MRRFFIFATLLALCSPLAGQTKKFSTDSLRVNNFLSVRLPASAFSGFGDGILGSMGLVTLSDTTNASSFSIIPNIGGNVWLVANKTGSGTIPNINLVIGADAVAHFNSDNNFGVAGQSTFGTNAAGVIGIPNGTAPTTSPANIVQVYSEDVSGSAELKVRDEAGNVTVLSNPASFIWSKSGEATQTDSIRFVQGSNVTLTRSGNALTIAASAAAASGWTDNGTTVTVTTSTDMVGVGLTPTRAHFEQQGIVGNTAAIFGANSTGIGIITDTNPHIGFNSYFNSSWKAISTGFGGRIGINTSNGVMVFSSSSASVSTNASFTFPSPDHLNLTKEGYFGIGLIPTRAFFSQSGVIGGTTAMFGSGSTGISIGQANPFIGFNYYYNAADKAMATGFGGAFALNTSNGVMLFYSSTASAATDANFTTSTKFQVEADGDMSFGTKSPASGTWTFKSKPLLVSYEGTPAFSDSSMEFLVSSGQPTISFLSGDGDATNISVNNSDQITLNAASGGIVIDNWLIEAEVVADPSTAVLTSGNHMSFYRKNDKAVIAYNNGGTITYLTIPLDGTTILWTQSTSAP